jgi:hypothetical protein
MALSFPLSAAPSIVIEHQFCFWRLNKSSHGKESRVKCSDSSSSNNRRGWLRHHYDLSCSYVGEELDEEKRGQQLYQGQLLPHLGKTEGMK